MTVLSPEGNQGLTVLKDPTHVDDEWFAGMTAGLQRCVGEMTFLGGRPLLPVLERHLAALPPPATVAEHLLLRGIVLELMLRLGRQAGRLAAPPTLGPVPPIQAAGPVLSGFCLPDSSDAVASCLAWARAVAAELDRGRQPSVAERAAEWLDEHHAEPFDLKRVADAAHASPGHLARVFKAMFGLTMRQYQQCRRINRAIKMLLEPCAKVAVCAQATGFGSGHPFYRAFREITGTTPRALRAAVGGSGTGQAGRWTCGQCRWHVHCTGMAKARRDVA